VRGIPARVTEMSVMIRWVRYPEHSNAMSLLFDLATTLVDGKRQKEKILSRKTQSVCLALLLIL
jgi:hypothetical protein